jgi:hypothetical protein
MVGPGGGQDHSGGGELAGLTPRTIRRLFALVDQRQQYYETEVTVEMYELYNNKIQDVMHRVLHPGVKPPAISIFYDKKTKKVNVKNSAASPVANYDEAYEMFNKGNATRATSGTGLNASSSRSHLIFAMIIKSSDKRTGKTTLGKVRCSFLLFPLFLFAHLFFVCS